MSHGNVYVFAAHFLQEKHSMLQPPVYVDDDLTISIRRTHTRLSPDEAFRLPGDFLRKGTRELILSEQVDVVRELELADRLSG